MNRAFKYGDGLFETMKVISGTPMFWNDHLARLLFGAKLLKLDVDEKWLKKELLSAIESDTSDYPVARVRATIYRSGGGKYTPETNKIKWSLEVTPMDAQGYHLPEEGISLGVYDEVKLSRQPLSNAKTLNALPYVLASIYKTDAGWDDVLLKNDEGRIAEATSSNVFLVKGNEIVTPSLTEGCIKGVFRQQLLSKGLAQEGMVHLGDFENADSIFLTNVISGVRWVEKVSFLDKVFHRPTQIIDTIENLSSTL